MSCAYILKRPEFSNVGEQFAWEIEHRQTLYELPIVLPEAAWDALPDAISELSHVVRCAQSALDHLSGVMSQSLSSDPGMIAMVDLASRGLQHVSEHEAALLDDVEMVPRAAVGRMVQERADNEAKGKTA
ncbi:hypothetical protein PE067_08900 [Paracoccus sp. DMF-8]|uniref:hypothetical protein n=1 Tax=Paracoccus sp. DMF-8 TaxID=3019445 RepID=UPI0023E88BF6|nr:hypothetical protein [Paracoccus sp. DMF-8]MDF3606240.1 hypothetical protein [Paracoccus sp. DMF-8]